jgi:hypothetical protein
MKGHLMTYYPVDPQPACWALFDAGGIQTAWNNLNGNDALNPELAQIEAFKIVNGNRDDSAVYIVKCLWTESTTPNSFYEVNDRVYAPMGEEPDKVPPED